MEAISEQGRTLVSDHIRLHFQDQISNRRLAYANNLLELCQVLKGQYLLSRNNVDWLRTQMDRCAPFLEHIYAQWSLITNDNDTNLYGKHTR